MAGVYVYRTTAIAGDILPNDGRTQLNWVPCLTAFIAYDCALTDFKQSAIAVCDFITVDIVHQSKT